MVLKIESGSTSFLIIRFGSKEIREIRHGTLESGRIILRPLQMARQMQLLATSKSRLVPCILLIREKEIQEPLNLL